MRRAPLAAVVLLALLPASAARAGTRTGVKVSSANATTTISRLTLAEDGHVVRSARSRARIGAGQRLAVSDLRGETAVGVLSTSTGEPIGIVSFNLLTGAKKTLSTKGFSPVLSADARAIYYVRGTGSALPGRDAVRRIGRGGGPSTLVMSPPPARNWGALAMSANGETLLACAYTPLQGTSPADLARLRPPTLYAYALASQTLTRITTATPLSGAGCTSLDASPDGSRLAVGTNVTRGDDPRLVLVELSTGTVRGLGPAGRYRQASGWSPDGTRVVTLTASGAVGPRLVSAPSGVAGPTLGSASTSVRVSR